ncbi:MAG: transcriptional repressor LexA [bacterium]
MNSDILTLQEVAEYLKVDQRTVYRMVKSKQLPAFKVRNQWRFKKDAIDRWIENNIGDSKNNKVEVPIIGRVSAGLPLLAEENIDGTLTVDSLLIKNPDKVFALRVKGSSMVNAGIFDGDFVLVRQQPIVEQGEMVIALIEDEATVKRFYKDKGKIKLQPENDAMKPIIVDPADKNIMIVGKVEGVIRKI